MELEKFILQKFQVYIWDKLNYKIRYLLKNVRSKMLLVSQELLLKTSDAKIRNVNLQTKISVPIKAAFRPTSDESLKLLQP